MTLAHAEAGRVYRFFRGAEHADAFVRGEVMLSTLGTCRDYSDPQRGDPGEAVHAYAVQCENPPSETELIAMARALTPHAQASRTGLGYAIAAIRDAYLISTSGVFAPESMRPFGDACVEILDPGLFFSEVTLALQRQVPLEHARWGPVQYRGRVAADADAPPGDIGFIKPVRYAVQREVRFLWTVDRDGLLMPLTLRVPGVAQLARRIR
jgi:hypothetical protein